MNPVYNMLNEINYPFPNFIGATIEVWELASNFISSVGWNLLFISLALL